MLSPFMTVLVLVVLWLIVVVPMVLRRHDERRRDRSVELFGRSMRALGRRAGTPDADHASNPQVFVAHTAVPASTRRPVPAAQEALMYPPDRTELSEARVRMLSRRRRSLGTLIGGSIVFLVVGAMLGGALWVVAALFLAGLGGYLLFLRNQATRDRSRREYRQARAATRRPAGHDLTDAAPQMAVVPDSVVRIDDDDIELHSMDTIDLTGLYQEEPSLETAQRRAS